MTDLTKEIKEITDNKLNCRWEDWEKKSLKGLSWQLESLKDQKDVLKQNVNVLWNQMLPEKGKTLKNFLETDIKGKLVNMKNKWDQRSNNSKTVEAANTFVKEVWVELKTLCWNNSDIVMALQIYVNGLNDIQWKHATIPYDADRYGYKDGDIKRLFIDGFLGPHTYNALWLAVFKEELPKTNGYYFNRNEPRIIWKDLPWEPLTLPGLDKNGNFESWKTIEAIDSPKVKWAIELLYLFYDGVWSKEKLEVDLDSEIMKIMANPNLYNNDPSAIDHFDWYAIALRDLNRNIAWENKNLEKWRDAITKFINGAIPQKDAEFSILSALEYNIWAHEYVADQIASRKINITNAEYKQKKDDIEINPNDKGFSKFTEIMNKQRLEQEKAQRKFILETFNTAKLNATKDWATQEDKLVLCQMFGVESVDQVTSELIKEKTNTAIGLAKEDFENTMKDNYFRKRFLEENISWKKSDLDVFWSYAGNDKMLALFADIQGIWALDMSSENRETTKFIAQMIAEEAACFAIGALTAGVGWIALKAALYGRRGMKIARLANAVNRWANAGRKISKYNQVRNFVKWVNLAEKAVRAERTVKLSWRAMNWLANILWVSVQWVSFYQATNMLQNIFDGKPTFEWWDNIPENMKSIAMMGALRFVNKLIAAKKLVTISGKEINVNPFNQLAVKNTDKIFTKVGKIAGESLLWWWAIFTVEGMWEAIIDTNHDWTKEEFIQAVLMYMIFRGAGEFGKLRISKNPKTNKPEIQKPGKPEKPRKSEQGGKEKQWKEWKDKGKKSEEFDALKKDKRTYLEKQREINRKIKENQNKIEQNQKKLKWIEAKNTEIKKIQEEIGKIESELSSIKAKNGIDPMNEVKTRDRIELLKKNKTKYEADIKKLDAEINTLYGEINTFNNQKVLVDFNWDMNRLKSWDRIRIGDRIFQKELNTYKIIESWLPSEINTSWNLTKAVDGRFQFESRKGVFLEPWTKAQLEMSQANFIKYENNNLRLNRLQQAKHIDNINVILKNEIITKGGKEFTTKPEAENFLKRNASLLKKWAIITLIAWGSLVAYKTVKWAETETPNIIETNPVNLSDEELVDSVTINNNNQFIPTIEPIEE